MCSALLAGVFRDPFDQPLIKEVLFFIVWVVPTVLKEIIRAVGELAVYPIPQRGWRRKIVPAMRYKYWASDL